MVNPRVGEAEASPISNQQDDCDWRGDFDVVLPWITVAAEEVDDVLVVWRGFEVEGLALVVIGRMFDFLEQPEDTIAEAPYWCR